MIWVGLFLIYFCLGIGLWAGFELGRRDNRSELRFLTIYCKDIEASKLFYEANIGAVFKKERHGKGKEHYVSRLKNIIFELYPESESKKLILGFDASKEKLIDPDGNSIYHGFELPKDT